MHSTVGRLRRESRRYTYGRVEDAYYARNVEIRSRNKESSDQTIARSTVDELMRLRSDPSRSTRRTWATRRPDAHESMSQSRPIWIIRTWKSFHTSSVFTANFWR